MSWQICPICKGEGWSEKLIPVPGHPNSFTHICPTCNGARIISELNGLPPTAFGPTLQELEEEHEKVKEAKKQSEIKDIMERTEALRKERHDPPYNKLPA